MPFFIFRAEYVALLSAKTLSLDGMAGLNAALREVVQTENWSKHEHVQWIVGTLISLLDGLLPFT